MTLVTKEKQLPHVIAFGTDGDDMVPLATDADGNLGARNFIWNTSTLAWEKATGSLTGGSNVTVNNFPAVQPVSGTVTANAGTNLNTSLLSTAANQTNGTQLVNARMVDEFGVVSTEQLGDNYFSGVPVFIDEEHHEIHCGDSYSVSRSVDLANGASDDILVIVPNEQGTGQNQKLYHLLISYLTELETHYYLYEGPTVTGNGTQLTAYNRNRNSLNTTGLTFYFGPTVTGTGTLIKERHHGSGRSSGSDTRDAGEWVLKNNTSYLIRLTNATANNNYISWDIQHYVHPGI